MPSARQPHVAILLATHNGARHLPAQLDSIGAQQHADWTVYASDDASSDGTREILDRYRARWGGERLVVLDGPRAGYVANFMSLVRNPAVRGDYFAFCDQDDRWHPDKLSRALDWLQAQAPDLPALYCGRTRLIDEQGRETGLSPLFRRRPGFRNALVQSLAGGNTMVFDPACRRLMGRIDAATAIVSHDWWAYLVATGCGGPVYYDPSPALDYRQHAHNLIGAGTGVRVRLWRVRELMKGTHRQWNDAHIIALGSLSAELTPENRAVLAAFQQARSAGIAGRLGLLLRTRLYRQTRLGSLSLLLAALLRRL